jgi:hypothetical protein
MAKFEEMKILPSLIIKTHEPIKVLKTRFVSIFFGNCFRPPRQSNLPAEAARLFRFHTMSAQNLERGASKFMPLLMANLTTVALVNMGVKNDDGSICYII